MMFKELERFREDRHLTEVGNIVGNCLEEITEYTRATSEDERVDALGDNIVFSVNAIEAYGYNAELVMLEICKQINSRVGKWNESTKKWKKDIYQPHEYKADFNKCKR